MPQEKQLWPLAKVDVLQSMSSEEIERLAQLSASVHLGPGEAFDLEEGRCALLLLTSGRVRVHEPNATGPGLTIGLRGAPRRSAGMSLWG